MKNVLSIVMVMLMLAVPAVFAEDTTEEVERVEVLGIQPVVEKEAATTTEDVIILEDQVATAYSPEVAETEQIIISEEGVSAEVETKDNETTEIAGGREYNWLAQVADKLVLAFTFGDEKRANLMQKIAAKRESHYNFLLAKGKTAQAERYGEGTVKLLDKLNKVNEKIKVKEKRTVQKIENKSVAVKEKVQSKIQAKNETEPIKAKVAEKVRSNVNTKAKTRITETEEN